MRSRSTDESGHGQRGGHVLLMKAGTGREWGHVLLMKAGTGKEWGHVPMMKADTDKEWRIALVRLKRIRTKSGITF